jgi:hypothetical protein
MSTVFPDDEALVDPLPDDELLEQPAAATAATATIASADTSLRAFKMGSPCSLAHARPVGHAPHANFAGYFVTRRTGRAKAEAKNSCC